MVDRILKEHQLLNRAKSCDIIKDKKLEINIINLKKQTLKLCP